MPCNLNFNGCCGGRNYPIPIYTCTCNNTTNLSTNQIINPSSNLSFVVSTITTQSVLSGEIVTPTITFDRGTSITFDGTNGFILGEGTYLVSYSATGNVTTDGDFSFALYREGVIISTSQSSITTTIGSNVTVADNEIIIVTSPATIDLRNVGQNANIVGGNITLQRL